MAFLPFYIPKHKQLKVIIIGGGYAGLAALTALSRYASNIDIAIIDPQEQHLKVTHLHETFRHPLSDLQVAFKDIEKRFGCRHIQAALNPDEETLCQWQADNYLVLDEEVLSFDYLLVASGNKTKESSSPENVLSLQHFMTKTGPDLLA